MPQLPHWIPVAQRTRGSSVEVVHTGGAVAIDAAGKVLWAAGDPQMPTYFRSSAKPWQALPLVKSGAAEGFGFSNDELALSCASHDGEPIHAATAAGMLKKLGLTPDALLCGAHPPYNKPAAKALVAAGEKYSPLHNNCSGKHSGMLAGCLKNGWPINNYLDYDHPLQAAIRVELSEATGLDANALPWGVDGCGVPTYFLPLAAMARAFGKLGGATAGTNPPLARLADAMRAHPLLIEGHGGFDTALMTVTQGRLVSKRGGAALGCVGTRGGEGLVVKCGDGNSEVVPVLVMAALEKVGWLTPAETAELAPFSFVALTNVAGKLIGELRAII